MAERPQKQKKIQSKPISKKRKVFKYKINLFFAD